MHLLFPPLIKNRKTAKIFENGKRRFLRNIGDVRVHEEGREQISSKLNY